MAPSVAAAYAKDELIAIFTANSTSLEPMRELIKEECGIDPHDHRFVIVGCQDVPIFGDAVRDGKKVDWEAATPHIVKLAEDNLRKSGDRIVYSGTGGTTGWYQEDAFVKASEPPACFELFDDAEEGVYVGWAAIDGHGGGAVHKAVLSIGWNPVYQNKERTVEAYICHDFDEDFYGAQMKLLICAFFRPQADFKDYEKPFEALIEAITTDVAFGKAALDSDALKGFREDGFFAAS